MRIILILFLILPLWLNKVKAQDHCSITPEDLYEKNNEFYKKAKSSAQSDASQLDKCHKLFKEHLDNCIETFKVSDFCKQAGTLPASDPGMLNAAKNQISQFVQSANCHWLVGACYKDMRSATGGSASGAPDRYKTCPHNKIKSQGEATRAAKEYGQNFYQEIDNLQGDCWRAKGSDFETKARQTLMQSKELETKDASLGAIDCMNHGNGQRVCRYSPGGSRFKVTSMEDDYPDVGDASPGKNTNFEQKPGAGCSGTLLGDGSTYVTVGHCYKDNPEQLLAVTDKDGKIQYAKASCAPGEYSDSNPVDIAFCKLKEPVAAKPVYYATLDESNMGSNCTDNGYVMSCGQGFFQNLSNQPVKMWAYPSQVDLNTGQVSRTLVETTGVMKYDTDTKLLTTDMMCTNGCSGAGYHVNVNGRTVIVGAAAYTTYEDISADAAVTPTETYKRLAVQSISTDKLESGNLLFQMMPR